MAYLIDYQAKTMAMINAIFDLLGTSCYSKLKTFKEEYTTQFINSHEGKQTTDIFV